MNNTHAAAFCFGTPLLIRRRKIPPHRCHAMPPHSFIYERVGAFAVTA